MTPIEVRGTTPDDFRREIEASLQQSRENKYASQVGFKDLDFDVDEGKLAELNLVVPFKTIDQAETALHAGAIRPVTFLEYDDTLHRLSIFDPRPVGFSGFMDCVTHSLVITDRGLFEVGRYPAVSLINPCDCPNFGWLLSSRHIWRY